MAEQTLQEELQEALAALPATADEIAAAFSNAGITGEQKNACGCPVANYLRGVGFALPTVAPFTCGVSGDKTQADNRARASLPAGAAEFVVRFDRGHYPELITAAGAA